MAMLVYQRVFLAPSVAPFVFSPIQQLSAHRSQQAPPWEANGSLEPSSWNQVQTRVAKAKTVKQDMLKLGFCCLWYWGSDLGSQGWWWFSYSELRSTPENQNPQNHRVVSSYCSIPRHHPRHILRCRWWVVGMSNHRNVSSIGPLGSMKPVSGSMSQDFCT